VFSSFGEVGEVLYPSLCIDPPVVPGYFGYSDWALHCVKDICILPMYLEAPHALNKFCRLLIK
jgi:hypothetical protein